MGEKTRCPKCGSTNVSIDKANAWLVDGRYNHLCNKCGFTSMFFTKIDKKDFDEIKKEAKQVKVDIVKDEKIDSNNQNWILIIATIAFIFLFGVIPALIIIGIYLIIKNLIRQD